MINIISEYLSLASNKYYGWNNFKIRRNYLYIPFLIASWAFIFIGFQNIIEVFSWSSQELINAFSIISWFLLTSISILIATTDIKKMNFDKIRKNAEIKIVISDDEELKAKYKEESDELVRDYIDGIKKTLLHEIVIQFLLIILITILISIIKSYEDWDSMTIYSIITFIATFLCILSFYLMTKLLKNFLKFQNFTTFKMN